MSKPKKSNLTKVVTYNFLASSQKIMSNGINIFVTNNSVYLLRNNTIKINETN